MTFIDKVFANFRRHKGFHVPLSGAGRERMTLEEKALGLIEKTGFGEYFYELLNGAESVDISNVTEWLFAGTDREHWDIAKGDFPALIPPFKKMVLESRRPSKIISRELSEHAKKLTPERLALAMPKRWAVVVQGRTIEEAEKLWTIRNQYKSIGEAHYADALEDAFKALADDPAKRARVKFVVTATLFIEPFGWELFEKLGLLQDIDQDGIMGPLTDLLWACDEHGDLLGEPLFIMRTGTLRLIYSIYKPPPGGWTDQKLREYAEESFGPSFFHSALMAITMMNCSNVALEKHAPPEKLNKRRVKDGKDPLITYRTLIIEPMKKVLRMDHGAPSTGAQLAMHVVRGHLKDYREGKGLFGKYKGLWWWSPHMAGSSEAGAVVKDYQIGEVRP